MKNKEKNIYRRGDYLIVNKWYNDQVNKKPNKKPLILSIRHIQSVSETINECLHFNLEGLLSFFIDNTEENQCELMEALNGKDESDDRKKVFVGLSLRDIDVSSQIERMFIRVSQGYEQQIRELYCLYESFWNGGDGYETYEDFEEEWDINDTKFVRENFKKFRKAALDYGWCLNGLLHIIQEVCPEAEAEEVDIEDWCDFTY